VPPDLVSAAESPRGPFVTEPRASADPAEPLAIHGESDEIDDLPELPPKLAASRTKILSSLPSWSPKVLDSGLRSNPVEVLERGLILQKNYAGADEDIWFLDTVRRQEIRTSATHRT